MRIVVLGAGGFIGNHLCRRLKTDGHWVRGVDIKAPQWSPTPVDEFQLRDLRGPAQAYLALLGDVDQVYQLAADMGGIGHISEHHAEIARNNVLINVSCLDAALVAPTRAPRWLYTSSACVYPAAAQKHAALAGLSEDEAWPADPEPGYGLEKLFSEKLCEYYARDHGLDVRVARLHNVYGPEGTWTGGREKAPAAICRKVAEATGAIDLWGDGQQTRSFCYVDDAIEGLVRLMASSHTRPLNLGSEELVSIEELARIVARVAGKDLSVHWDPTKPQGVRGRNSDNTTLREVLGGWEPRIPLAEGIARLYPWIAEQVRTA